MQITGMLWGRKLLDLVEFPRSEVRGPEASVEEIKEMIQKHKQVFIKPVFKGGVGKKGQSGLIGRVDNITDALKEKERLYFATHQDGNRLVKSNGVTFEGGGRCVQGRRLGQNIRHPRIPQGGADAQGSEQKGAGL